MKWGDESTKRTVTSRGVREAHIVSKENGLGQNDRFGWLWFLIYPGGNVVDVKTKRMVGREKRITPYAVRAAER